MCFLRGDCCVVSSWQTVNQIRVKALYDDLKVQIETRLNDVTADAAKPQRSKTRRRSNNRNSDSDLEYDSAHASDADSIDDGCYKSNTIIGQGGRAVEVSQPTEFTHKVCKVTDPLPLEIITTEQIVTLEQGLREVVCSGNVCGWGVPCTSPHQPIVFRNVARRTQECNLSSEVDTNHSRTPKQGDATDSVGYPESCGFQRGFEST